MQLGIYVCTCMYVQVYETRCMDLRVQVSEYVYSIERLYSAPMKDISLLPALVNKLVPFAIGVLEI